MSETKDDRCPDCGAQLSEGQLSSACPACGHFLPPEVAERLFARFAKDHPPRPMRRDAVIAVGVFGALFVVLGALRWNSIESQLLRGLGGSDALGIALLLAGVAGVLFSGVALLSPTGANSLDKPSSGNHVSPEARLRQLDDLRSKDLITDDEYRQRKEDVISRL